MPENKHTPIEGEDGRLYFRYPKGARYQFVSTTGLPLFEYAVEDCAYSDGEEWYTLSCNGARLDRDMTVEQVSLIFSFYDYQTLDPGIAFELPLLEEEVKFYYTDLGKESRKANVEANAKLKETQYFKLKAQIDKISPTLRFAQSEGNTQKTVELSEQIRKLSAEQHKILEACGVDIDVLTKKKKCNICDDTGFTTDGAICKCAYAREDEIKAYNAELRRARHR